MEIIWHGYKCFQVKTKSAAVLVDPYKAEVGIQMPNVKTDVIVFTNENDSENNMEMAPAGTKFFSWPGEYEVSGIALTIKKLSESSSFISFDIDNIRICYLTDLTLDLTDEKISEFGNVDILIVPVDQKKGGFSKVHELLEELEPRVVIPIFYATPGLKIELDEIGPFLKKAGISQSVDSMEKEKFTVNSKSSLPQEKTEYVILKPQVA